MEKLPDGGSVFRSAQAEEKCQQQHARSQQDRMEKMYHQMEQKFEDLDDEGNVIYRLNNQ